jgi:DnaJ-domain-containing protein 1
LSGRRVAARTGGKRFGTVSTEERIRLKQREAELLKRINRLKQAMNETRELETLANKGQLFKKAQEELRRVQERLAGIDAGH